MAYGTKYIMSFTNQLNEFYEVYFEFLDFIGSPLPIIASVQGFTLRATDGDEDKFYPVIGTECLLQIVVGKTNDRGQLIDDSTLTIFDLIATQDNQIRVTIYFNRDYTKSFYQGFVVVEDNFQPFQDPPFILNIRALDGLGLLKNTDMVNNAGDLYTGIMSIADWIGNILMKTGQTLNLRIYFPFYPAGASETMSALVQVFLDAITWQKGELVPTTDPSIDVFQSAAADAYTALETIARCHRSKVFQQDGVWNFMNLYSLVDPAGMYYHEFEATVSGDVYTMTQVSVGVGLNQDVPIGRQETMHLTQNDANLYLKLATKWIKLNYTYDQAVNKVCNQELKYGNPNPTFDGTISSTIEDPSINPPVTFTTKGYDNFCWPGFAGTSVLGGTQPFPETAQTADIYIRSVLDDVSVLENRYMVITDEAVANHVKSSTFLIDVNDALQVSVDFRTMTDMGTGIAISPLVILLNGDDGSKWGLGWNGFVTGAEWILLDADYNIPGQTNPPLNFHSYVTGEKTTDWVNIVVDRGLTNNILKVPISGECFILMQGLQTGSGGESWWKNLRITILPYLAGSYVQLKGDYNFSASTLDIKQTRSEIVEISDSPKRYFKGALVDSSHELIPQTWHRRGVTESYGFCRLMERIIYNNIVTQCQKIEGTVRGVTWRKTDFSINQVGIANRYYFVNHPSSPTMKFILTSFEIDYGKGAGRRVYVQILASENDNGWAAPNDYKFDYLLQQ